jgi:hypothetical protein
VADLRLRFREFYHQQHVDSDSEVAGLQALNQAGLGNDNCQTHLVQLNPRTISDIFDTIFQVPVCSYRTLLLVTADVV